MCNVIDTDRLATPIGNLEKLASKFLRRSMLDDQSGASLAEYALLLFLIALPAAVVLPNLGAAISNLIQLLADAF